MSARQAEQVPVRNLLRCGRLAHFWHDRRRNRIGPEHVLTSRRGEEQKSISRALSRPPAAWQLRTDANDAEFSDGARRPPLPNRFGFEPVDRCVVMLMLGYEQGHQYVNVEKASHVRR